MPINKELYVKASDHHKRKNETQRRRFMKTIISEYMKDYLKSIGYELSDMEKAILILNTVDIFDQRKELFKLAKSTTDSKLTNMIYARYELKNLAKELFDTNDGTYIYVLTEEGEDIYEVFKHIKDVTIFAKKEPSNFSNYLVQRRKIITSVDSHHFTDYAIFEYRQRREPECVVPDTDMLEKLKAAAYKKEILPHNYKLNIPTPFQKGDIVFFDFDNYRKIGILENDCTQYEPEKNLPTVAYINDSGYINNSIFYPYTAELAHSYYDTDIWNALVKMSDILKGGTKYKITQIFEKVYC